MNIEMKRHGDMPHDVLDGEDLTFHKTDIVTASEADKLMGTATSLSSDSYSLFLLFLLSLLYFARLITRA